MKYVAFLLLIIVLSACSQEPNNVHFTLPDDYQGAVLLAEVDGFDDGYEIIEGVYSYRIPATGVLCVHPNSTPFRYFRLTGEYENGQLLYPYADSWGQRRPDDENLNEIRALGQRQAQYPAGLGDPVRHYPLELLFAVGTQQQIQQVNSTLSSVREGFDIERCQKR